MHVVLIEDDRALGRELVNILETNGHDVIWCHHAAIAHVSRLGKNIILFGLGSSGRAGMNTLVRMCQISEAPVLALVATTGQADLEQLRRGGELLEDCKVRPVDRRELLEKVELVAQKAAVRSKRVVVAIDVTISFEARAVWVGDKEVSLTTKEFEVLTVLAHQAGRVVSRRRIEEKVWGASSCGLSRSLDVHMATLRAKLDRPDLIQTVRGYGYRFGSPAGAPRAQRAVEPSPSSRSAKTLAMRPRELSPTG